MRVRETNAGRMGMEAMIYDIPSYNPEEVKQSMMERFGGSTFIHFSAAFDRAKEFMDTDFLLNVKSGLRNLAVVLNDNVMRPLRSLYELSTAPPIMRRWVLANPLLSRAFVKQQLSGYDDLFTREQIHEDGHGVDNPYYRAVTNGLYVDDCEGEGITTYESSSDDDSLGLDVDDQVAIMNSWLTAEDLWKAGKDPTEP